MPFLTKDRLDVVMRLLENLKRETPFNKTHKGSNTRAILESLYDEIKELRDHIDMNVEPKVFLNEASGSNLDQFADDFNLSRNSATKAYDNSFSNAYFYIDPIYKTVDALLNEFYTEEEIASIDNIDSGEITITEGTELHTNDGVAYVTQEDITINDSNIKSAFVNVQSRITGDGANISANSLINHNIGSHQPDLQRISQFILSNNNYDVKNANNLQTDADLRNEIYNFFRANANATAESIRQAILDVPGINNVHIFEQNRGVGTADAMIVPTAALPNDGLIETAQQRVNGVKAMGDRVTVIPPDYQGIFMTITIFFNGSQSSSVKLDVKKRVIDFINNIDMASTLDLNDLKQTIFAVNDKIIDVNYDRMVLGPYDYQNHQMSNMRIADISNQTVADRQLFYTDNQLITICVENV